ncbi:anti-phage ZorAB system protein ZorA [Myceligenerans indicum]|uniref:Anti-phage defense ZorAB system ZorA n=1 Tax=Myceligenerans indicum TaxID=2593663 RepID=A0ABS1LK20_9MICO|nr:anti-phage ZorAB system protein ZorA [Myceligenerans indicum]MBL0886374.1 anti-phage defense ZorAB system ZorA [Myceligenerans indicum]
MSLQSPLEAFWPHGPISIVVCALVALLFFLAMWLVLRGGHRARRRIVHLSQFLRGLRQDDLAVRRGELAALADGAADDHVRDAWREFDETLVSSPDRSRLWNTQNAETFFGTAALAPEVMHNRFLASAPSILTALGVLGTFAGLAYGLRGLDLSGSTGADMMPGLNGLVAGAGAAFVSSLWGVFFSLALTVVHRIVEHRLDAGIKDVQRTIDGLFENHSPEESLLRIQQHTDDSAKALDDMAEKIGNKLQEVVARNHAQAAVQSSEVFEVLVEKFTEEFRMMGSSLASRLENATTELSSTLNGMAEATARQVELLDKHLPRIVTDLNEATQRLKEAGDGLGPVSEKLRATADIFDRSAGALGDAVADGVEKLDELSERTAGTVTTAAQVGESLESLSRTTLTAADRIGEAAGQVNNGFTDLQSRLKALTDSVNEWLNDYEREVSKQVENRMSEWNTHTRDYSDQMTRVTRALADLVEGLESSAVRSGQQFDGLHLRLGEYTNTLGEAVAHLSATPAVVTQAVPAVEEVTRAASDAADAQN